jgi:hypothetical protein
MANEMIKQAFNYLQNNESNMSQHQINFIGSLKKSFTKTKRLSDKQQMILFEIQKYVLRIS